jgi:Ni/Co efflux regulator RcnB
MSKLTLVVAAMALAHCANTLAQSATSSETRLRQLVADCNGAANSSKRRAISACETLDKEGRLSLAEPAAVTAYQRYQEDRLPACQRRQASPRGQSRGPSNCGPSGAP